MRRFLCVLLSVAFLSVGTWGGEAQRHPVLEVTEWSTAWQRLSVTIENPSTETQQGLLVVWFIEEGVLTGWGFDITVPPRTRKILVINLPATYPIVDVEVYVNGFPDGVTEAPDPVVNAIEEKTETLD